MTDDVIRSVVDEHWRSEQRVEAVTTVPGKIPHVTERFVSLGLKNEASVQVAKNKADKMATWSWLQMQHNFHKTPY